MYVCMYACVYIYMYVCVYVCMYVGMRVCFVLFCSNYIILQHVSLGWLLASIVSDLGNKLHYTKWLIKLPQRTSYEVRSVPLISQLLAFVG